MSAPTLCNLSKTKFSFLIPITLYANQIYAIPFLNLMNKTNHDRGDRRSANSGLLVKDIVTLYDKLSYYRTLS